MESKHPFVEIIRLSSEMVEESAKLRIRAREAMYQSAVIIDRSRELLSLWAVSGTSALTKTRPEEPAIIGSQRVPATREEVPPPNVQTLLERVAEQDFADEAVRLDGRHFVDCNMKNCVLEYCGGPLILEGTNFTGCHFRFGSEAAMTVSMLECFGLIEEQYEKAVGSPLRLSSAGRVN